MSAMRKAAQYLGFDVSREAEYGYEDEELAPVTHLTDVSEVREQRESSPVRAVPSERERTPASSMSPSDLRRIQTVKPRNYNDAKRIGEAFRQGVPVIMNLSEMSDSDAKRMVDFSAGLSFGLHGSIERVTTSVFLLSPAHVEIGMDSGPVVQESEFFNER